MASRIPYEKLTARGQVRRLRRHAHEVLRTHGLQASRLDSLVHGENTTFRAKTGRGEVLVRLHRPGYQSPETIRSELAWLRALREDTDLVVPRPLADPVEVLGVGAGPRQGVLFDWIPGRFQTKPTLATFHRLGRVMGTLHTHGASWRPPTEFRRQRWDVAGMAGGNMGGSLGLLDDSAHALFVEAVERFGAVAANLGQSREVFGLMHSDLHHGNRLAHQGTMAVIDFDDSGFGWFLYDFGPALLWPWLRHRDAYPAISGALFDGYREVRPIAAEHVDLMPAFFAMRFVAITLWVLARADDNPYFAERSPGQVAMAVREISELLKSPVW